MRMVFKSEEIAIARAFTSTHGANFIENPLSQGGRGPG